MLYSNDFYFFVLNLINFILILLEFDIWMSIGSIHFYIYRRLLIFNQKSQKCMYGHNLCTTTTNDFFLSL